MPFSTRSFESAWRDHRTRLVERQGADPAQPHENHPAAVERAAGRQGQRPLEVDRRRHFAVAEMSPATCAAESSFCRAPRRRRRVPPGKCGPPGGPAAQRFVEGRAEAQLADHLFGRARTPRRRFRRAAGRTARRPRSRAGKRRWPRCRGRNRRSPPRSPGCRAPPSGRRGRNRSPPAAAPPRFWWRARESGPGSAEAAASSRFSTSQRSSTSIGWRVGKTRPCSAARSLRSSPPALPRRRRAAARHPLGTRRGCGPGERLSRLAGAGRRGRRPPARGGWRMAAFFASASSSWRTLARIAAASTGAAWRMPSSRKRCSPSLVATTWLLVAFFGQPENRVPGRRLQLPPRGPLDAPAAARHHRSRIFFGQLVEAGAGRQLLLDLRHHRFGVLARRGVGGGRPQVDGG